jgi:excisionase family DNA binding protein
MGALLGLAAVHEARRSGQGQVVDLALYETMFAMLGPLVIDYDQNGRIQERTGSRLPWVAPRNVYRTRDDRWVSLSASSDRSFERLCEALDLADLELPYDLPAPDLAVRPRYSARTAAAFDRAARICRSDGGGPLRPLHLLVALGDPELPLMRRVLATLGLDAAGWRRLLASIGPPAGPGPAPPSVTEPPARVASDLLSPEQAAAELGVHIQTLRGYIRRGKLVAFRLAGERAIRIRRDDLLALLAQPIDSGPASSGQG